MRRLHRHPDEGFSMVEVIVAIVILGIVASSALWFFINGMQTSSNLDRQQTAVSIATSTMEQTFTYDPRKGATTGVSGLVVGRSAADVASGFAALGPTGPGSLALNNGLGISGVADTYPLSDPAGVTGGGDPKVVSTVTRGNNVNYTVYTLIGACYRTAATGGTTQPCTKDPSYPTTEPTNAPGMVRMLRVIVVVIWDPIGNECTGTLGKCEYDVATLVDPSLDLLWTRIVQPVAKDDTFSFGPTDAGYNLDVLNNDVLGSVRSFPVQLVAPFLNASGVDGTATANSTGTIKYVPPVGDKAHWVSGIFPFKYQVFDRTGASGTATVSIYLQPQSADDPSLTATLGVPQALDVLGNDLGSPALVTITQQPSSGNVAVSGGTTVTFTATAKGPFTFKYKYSDASGLVSPEATVSVTVQSVSAPDVPLVAPYNTNASAPGSWMDITATLLAGAPTGTQVVITQAPAPASGTSGTAKLRIDGIAYSGGTVTVNSKIEFQPPVNTAGEWTFPYALTVGTFQSNTGTVDVKVPTPPPPPKAANDTFNLKKNGTRTVAVGGNDTPKTWGSSSGITVQLGAFSPTACGSWAYATPTPTDLDMGQLSIVTPNSFGPGYGGCTVKYTLVNVSGSSTATITFTVTP